MKSSLTYCCAAGLIAVMVTTSAPVRGQVFNEAPKEVDNIGVDEHLGAKLPLDEQYFDELGRNLPLSQYFFRDRPVIISFNYSNCPQLCNVQLTEFVRTLQQMELRPGEDFEFISLSIDPQERPAQARATRNKYVARYGDLDTEDGWHFLTGKQDAIDRLTETAGFRYNFVRERNQYAHTAVMVVCSPDGNIAGYLYGIETPPKTLRLALVDAANGEIGSWTDQLILWCFSYDPNSNSYVPEALQIMKIGGVATVIILAAICVPFWLARPRRRAPGGKSPDQPAQPPAAICPDPTYPDSMSPGDISKASP